MAYYRNNYEAYYRKMRNGSIKDKDNMCEISKRTMRKNGTICKILIYDLALSLVLLLSLITLKNIQNEDLNVLYSEVESRINEKNEKLENYNSNFYNEALDVFNSISDAKGSN